MKFLFSIIFIFCLILHTTNALWSALAWAFTKVVIAQIAAGSRTWYEEKMSGLSMRDEGNVFLLSGKTVVSHVNVNFMVDKTYAWLPIGVGYQIQDGNTIKGMVDKVAEADPNVTVKLILIKSDWQSTTITCGRNQKVKCLSWKPTFYMSLSKDTGFGWNEAELKKGEINQGSRDCDRACPAN